MNFKVNTIDPVAIWKWDIKLTNCPICKSSLNEPSVGISSNEYVSDYSIYTTIYESICGHCYHQDCIQKWLSIRKVCPLCNENWILTNKKTIEINTAL